MKLLIARQRLNLFLGCCLLLSAGCAPVIESSSVQQPEAGTFTLFLQPLPQEADRLSFSLGELAALKSNGTRVPLPLAESHFSADVLIGVQKKLLNLSLPPGHYQGIALQISSAAIQGEEGAVALLAPSERLSVAYPFTIRENQAETLFLTLSSDRLITDGALFTPKFSLWKPERILTNLKGFVSNSGSQSLTVFNKRSVQVLGNLRVGKNPSDLVLDQRRNWLYVALEHEHAIAVVEVANGTVLGRVPLRFGDEPSELALTANGNILLCLNHGSESISIIDTGSLFEIGRIRMLSVPSGIWGGVDETRAYVVHASTNTLSVIDLQQQRILKTLSLEESPLDGVTSANGRFLYLINDFSAELSVLDASSLATLEKIFVGDGALTIKADNATGLLYIGKQNGEIAVVDPRALMAIDAFLLPAPAVDITIDNEENALFVVLPKLARLLKLDLVSKKELGRLEIETGSRAVVVMGER